MATVNTTVGIDPADIRIEFVRSSGPGGQNVNKVATAAQLRFDTNSKSLPPEVRERLLKLAGKRVTSSGELVIDARRHRTQQLNREDAMQRLAALIEKASTPPEVRHKTRPPAGAKLRRLDEKKHHADIKRLRGRAGMDD
ncbi:MAG: aminoacyl-tRNA hydrolase [Acidobacteriota bacterium]|jgi:ribosome-associated protein|nr:aminoacyl-tRNA hydrolase [Acidobacteriota bacterium]